MDIQQPFSIFQDIFIDFWAAGLQLYTGEIMYTLMNRGNKHMVASLSGFWHIGVSKEIFSSNHVWLEIILRH